LKLPRIGVALLGLSTEKENQIRTEDLFGEPDAISMLDAKMRKIAENKKKLT